MLIMQITEALQGLEDWFGRRTCQLFKIVRDRHVEPEASAFLLDIYGTRLMVTAGHVLVNGNHDRLCFPNKSSQGMTSLEGTWYPSSETNKLVGQDSDDFAYLILNDDLCDTLSSNSYEFIIPDNIELDHHPSPGEIYTAIGFKWRKTKRTGADHRSIMEVISNFGAPASKYDQGEGSGSLILMANNHKMLHPPKKELHITGYLDGMSGGPLWNTKLTHSYSPDSPTIKLVGILHSYDSNLIRSTNINRLFEVLFRREHLPIEKYLKWLSQKKMEGIM